MKKPNLLVILTDQQHSRMMGCAGNPWVQTPAMDSLAATGIRFERAYCTNPVCVPSRFSMFTGHMPSHIGMWGNGKPREDANASEFEQAGIGWRLRKAGYETVYGGKVHLPLKLKPEGLGFHDLTRDERDGLAESCADYLRERTPDDQPFCMVASFINPHDICYMAIRDFPTSDMDHVLLRKGDVECATLDAALQRPEGVSEAAFFAEHCPPLPPNLEPQADEPEMIQRMVQDRAFRRLAREQYGEKEWRMHRWAYKRLTEMVDAQIGKVLDALRASGLEEETVVIFTSDHGDLDAAHRLEHKSAFYEESASVPFIISQKGVTPVGEVDVIHPVSNGLDLIPTLCDYAGIAKPHGLSGRSLRPLAEGEKPDWREAVPVESSLGRMVAGTRYKYVRHFDGANAEQLYDLETDPHEMRNSLEAEGNHGVVEHHRALFEVLHGATLQGESAGALEKGLDRGLVQTSKRSGG